MGVKQGYKKLKIYIKEGEYIGMTESEQKKIELATAKKIFKEMYDLIKAEKDQIIFISAYDVKIIAKRYGVKL